MIKSINSVKVSGRRVIVRAGFDVPIQRNAHTEEWEVADDARIRDILPTLRYLIEQRAKIIIISHLDRPDTWEKDKSLWPAAQKLAELVKYKIVKTSARKPEYSVPHVYFLSENITKTDFSGLTHELPDGDILFLENLRFYDGEMSNDEKFAETLAKYGDVYCNDAFSVAHRKEASTFALAHLLPHYGGVALMKEISSLRKLIHNPAQPMIVIMGGAKIDDKVETINNLAPHTSHILIGGALGNTFLAAIGYEVGKSKISNVKVAKEILRHYKEKIVLPVDVVVGEPNGKAKALKIDKVKPSESIFDIGPETIRKFTQYIKQGKTLVWNGPVGMFENPKFAFGSKAIAHAFAAQSKGKAFGVVGGGETAEVIDLTKTAQFIDHISTGGGAMLEFLAGKTLPGIKALES